MSEVLWVSLIVVGALVALKAVRGLLRFLVSLIVFGGVIFLVYALVTKGIYTFEGRRHGEWERLVAQAPVVGQVSSWVENIWFNIRRFLM